MALEGENGGQGRKSVKWIKIYEHRHKTGKGSKAGGRERGRERNSKRKSLVRIRAGNARWRRRTRNVTMLRMGGGGR